MKLRDFENIRKVEILTPLIIAGCYYIGINPYDLSFQEVHDLCNIISLFGGFEIFTSQRTSRLASDYKEIKDMYNEVISNTGGLINNFGLKNPIEIFAFYVYLYRNGYLSYNHNFVYNSEMKDLPNLLGVDVVLGSGVCRSISSMLVDIYNNQGFESTNLSVNAEISSCKNQQKLCDTELNKTEKSKKMVDFIIKFTKVIKMPNHMITQVVDDGHNYLLDPTNDGILNYDGNSKKIYVGNLDQSMTNNKIIQKLTHIGGTVDFKKISKTLDTNFSEEEYQQIYLKTLKLCKDNLSYLKSFYDDNNFLYEDIHKLCDDQKSLIGRIIPFIPSKEEKAKYSKLYNKIFRKKEV